MRTEPAMRWVLCLGVGLGASSLRGEGSRPDGWERPEFPVRLRPAEPVPVFQGRSGLFLDLDRLPEAVRGNSLSEAVVVVRSPQGGSGSSRVAATRSDRPGSPRTYVVWPVGGAAPSRCELYLSPRADRTPTGTGAHPPAEDPLINPLSNGGFERDSRGSGVPDGWAFSDDRRALSLSSEQAHSGRRSVRLDPAGIGQNAFITMTYSFSRGELDSIRGQRVWLRGWILTQGSGDPPRVRLRQFSSIWLGDALDFQIVDHPGRWTQFTASGVLRGDDMTRANLFIFLRGRGEGVACLDDLEMFVEPAPLLRISTDKPEYFASDGSVYVTCDLAPAGRPGWRDTTGTLEQRSKGTAVEIPIALLDVLPTGYEAILTIEMCPAGTDRVVAAGTIRVKAGQRGWAALRVGGLEPGDYTVRAATHDRPSLPAVTSIRRVVGPFDE
jgi:hypothetical protein